MTVVWPEGHTHTISITHQQAKPSLVGMTRADIKNLMLQLGLKESEAKMRTTQIFNWVYGRGAKHWDDMTNVANSLKKTLNEHVSLERPDIVALQVSSDGTRKFLLRYPQTSPKEKPVEIECVYIPEQDRGTLCVSSQVGCTLTCTFCHTGTQKLVRNLTTAEILAQLIVTRDMLGDWPNQSPPESAIVPRDGGRFVTNIVMMGMGEPLYNYENVREALLSMMAEDGLAISKRKITLSTSGVVPMIEACGRETGVMLAVSLHAVHDDLRNELVPLNKKYPIAQLLEACRHYPGVSNARRITFEYVMLKGVNDSLSDAQELVRLLKGIHAKINLIPFNPWPGTRYECSSWSTIERFADVLSRAGFASPIRTPRGRDILAACGQLKSETERLTAKQKALLYEEATSV